MSGSIVLSRDTAFQAVLAVCRANNRCIARLPGFCRPHGLKTRVTLDPTVWTGGFQCPLTPQARICSRIPPYLNVLTMSLA